MSVLAPQLITGATLRRGRGTLEAARRRRRVLDILLWLFAAFTAVLAILLFPGRTQAAPHSLPKEVVRPAAIAKAPKPIPVQVAAPEVRWKITPVAWIGSTDPFEDAALKARQEIRRTSAGN
jgi:hypothetical protein